MVLLKWHGPRICRNWEGRKKNMVDSHAEMYNGVDEQRSEIQVSHPVLRKITARSRVHME